MACQVFVDAQRLLHLCVFVVGFNVWTILIRCKDVLQDVPAVAVVAVQVYIVGACSHVVDGQCVVSDVIAAVGSYGIATVALTIPAEVNTVELQLVGLVAVVDYLHTSVAWHHHLVPIVGVAMVVAVQIAQMEGEVATIYPKVGELIGSGSPIMTISLIDDVWGAFNMREDQLKGLKIGDKFKAFLPAFNQEIELKVTSIKDQGSYATWKATKSNGQYDMKTFEVKARPTKKFDGLRPGMSVIIK